MTTIISIILGMFLSAIFVDYVLQEKGVKAWQDTSKKWWESLGQIDFNKVISGANEYFLELFDRVYDKRMFSWRRIYRSAISSYLAIVFVALILGIDRIEGVNLPGNFNIFFVMLAFCIWLNLIPDFISLQETRWIMKKSLKNRSKWVLLWFVIDLILTNYIYIFYFTCFITVSNIASGTEIPIEYILFMIKPSFVKILFFNPFDFPDPFFSMMLVFYISTFFTSAIWFLFIFSAIIIHLLQRISPFLKILLKVIAQSEKPARTTAGFLSLILIFGYGLYYVLYSLITNF